MVREVQATLDKSAIRRGFDRRAAGYLHAAQVQSEVCRRMLERLDLVKLDPATILDAGSGPCLVAGEIDRRFPRAHLIALDFSLGMLSGLRNETSLRRWLRLKRAGRIAPVCADFESLPLAAQSMDCVLSNLALPWAEDVSSTFAEFFRALKPGGLLMFTSLGPDTLREWRASAQGALLASRLPDMHDLGDILVHRGFSGPVMDQEHLRLTYTSRAAVLRDLRAWGATDASRTRPRGLCRRDRHFLLSRNESDAGIELTLEIIYGHAWKPSQPATAQRVPDGRSVIRFDRAARRP